MQAVFAIRLARFAAIFAAFSICLVTAALAAGSLAISDKIVFPVQAGEAQSTVVPPGVKAECPAGRLFLSNDNMVKRTPIPKGAVLWRDLDKLDAPAQQATFGAMPNAQYFTSGTDHDLVSLHNGDLLLIDMTSSKAPIEPKPPWFDQTYRDDKKSGDFGPGARTVIGIWRSVDCGNSFSFAALVETADYEDGSCAWPQRAEWNPDAHHPLDMGGSDGISAHVNVTGDRIIIINQCVGYKRDMAITNAFVLTKERLNKSVVVESTDNGVTWKFLGMFPKAEWRRSFVDRGNSVAFAVGTGVTFGNRQPNQSLVFDQDSSLVPNLSRSGVVTPGAKTLNATYGNIWAHTMLTRVPRSPRLLLTVPNLIKRSSGETNGGYRVFLFDPAAKAFAELPPVLPETDGADNYMMHLVAIDIGNGPIMLYWSEFDLETRTGRVRGRLIFSTTEATDDFAVSLQGGQASTWTLEPNRHYWYGDYQTAWGYREPTPATGGTHDPVFHYYPMWIEANRTVGFAHVTLTVPADNRDIGTLSGPRAPRIAPIPGTLFNIPARTIRTAEVEDMVMTAEHEEEGGDDDDDDKDR